MQTKNDDDLDLGYISKTIEAMTFHKGGFNKPMRIILLQPFLDEIADKHPDTYLGLIESVSNAFKEPKTATYSEKTLKVESKDGAKVEAVKIGGTMYVSAVNEIKCDTLTLHNVVSSYKCATMVAMKKGTIITLHYQFHFELGEKTTHNGLGYDERFSYTIRVKPSDIAGYPNKKEGEEYNEKNLMFVAYLSGWYLSRATYCYLRMLAKRIKGDNNAYL